MRSKLILASIWTLGLLFGMLSAIVLLIMYWAGAIDVWLLFGLTILINVLTWLASPKIMDWTQKFFYKAVFFDKDSFTAAYPQYTKFIAEHCQKNNVPFPKIGFIDDDNPTAYSYGSGRWNSRLVFTQGILTYLEEDEVNAVLAHELGHIVHRDFIVMSIANTIIQLLYETYYVLSRGRGNNKDSGRLAAIGWVAYVFYWIGVYIVLFLNRLREYYADEFSAEATGQPEALSRALVKVAYGIMAKEDDAKSKRLLESTKTMGIMSLQTAKGAGLAVRVTGMQPDKVAKVMLFDVVSPWAKLAELSATHPLTGKRLRRLDEMAVASGRKPTYDLETAKQESALDNKRLWKGFLFGSFMYFLPIISIVFVLAAAGILVGIFSVDSTLVGLGVLPVLVSLFIIRVFYRYPSIKNAQPTDIYSMMTDLYASPVRGQPVQVSGQIVGRGVPGFMFGEDMMIQDKTGLLYLDYEGPFGFFSNLIFALKKFKKFLGMSVDAKGWFYRSNTQFMQLKDVQGPDGRVKSYPRLWSFVGSILLALVISLFIFLILALDYGTAAPSSYQDINATTGTGYDPSLINTTDNKCYRIKLPQDSTVVRTEECNLTATFIRQAVDGRSYQYKVSLLALPSGSQSFSDILNAWEAQNNINPGAQRTPVAVANEGNWAGLSDVYLQYNNDSSTGQATQTWLIDSRPKLKGPSNSYYTELTFTNDTLVQSEISNVISSLKIKDAQLNQ